MLDMMHSIGYKFFAVEGKALAVLSFYILTVYGGFDGWPGRASLFLYSKESMSKGISQEQLAALVRSAAEPVASSMGLVVWGIELTGGGRTVVRLFLDKGPGASCGSGQEPVPGEVQDVVQRGVSIDQCAEISRLVGLALDVEDVMPGAWVLEVSSPGFERVFFSPAQMVPYIGRELDVVLAEPHPRIAGRRRFKGPLRSVEKNSFVVEVLAAQDPEGDLRPVEVPIQWNMVKKAHLVHIFPETGRPGAGKRSARAGKAGGKQK